MHSLPIAPAPFTAGAALAGAVMEDRPHKRGSAGGLTEDPLSEPALAPLRQIQTMLGWVCGSDEFVRGIEISQPVETTEQAVR